MTLEMRSGIDDREFKGRHLTFRIGMIPDPLRQHGRKKSIYDFWGNAVNIAAGFAEPPVLYCSK
jgi:hypothetical protein